MKAKDAEIDTLRGARGAWRERAEAAEAKLQTTEAARDEAKEALAWIGRKLRLPEDAQMFSGQETIAGRLHVLDHQAHGYMAYIESSKCDDKQGEIARLTVRAEVAESRLSSLTQAHARLRTAAQGVLDRNGGPTDTPYGPFVFVARADFDAMDAALKADDLAGRGQSAEDGATAQLARLTQAQQRLIAEWTEKAKKAEESSVEAESKRLLATATGLLERTATLRECIADLAAVAETKEGKP